MAKIALSFEIKVALLGNVSAGKTTLLNALFRDKVSEVSMKRTTAGVNFFHIYPKTASSHASSSGSESTETSSVEWMMIPDSPRTAESTLKEITADNAALRESDDEVVEEKAFEIELDEPLCKMRKNTKLVFVDIPGINEAGASHKYMDYVAENWNTFDCAVIVMDGRQGVNTDEQVNLLKFAKANLAKKNIPIIILCNKVDDPDEEEQAEQVAEARREVEKIFEVPDRVTALEALIVDGSSADPDEMFPVFIPLSAVNGYIFRCASKMTLEQFKRLDKEYIDKLGKERIGRALWRKMSPGKRMKKAHEAVIDPDGYKAALEESNFDTFLRALSESIGGEDVQRALIEKQIQVSLDSVSPSDGIVSHLRSAYMKTQALSATRSGDQSESFDDASLKATFWRVYKECETSSFTKFDSSPCHVASLVNPMQELIDYHLFSEECGWEEEHEKIRKQAKTLIRRQIETIVREEAKPDSKFLVVARENAAHIWRWRELSPLDWAAIVGSITLLSHDRFFCEGFGREKMMLEHRLADLQAQTQACCKDLIQDQVISCQNNSCNGTLNFNRQCGTCKVFTWLGGLPRCPRMCHEGYLYVNNHSQPKQKCCSACSNVFFPIDWATETYI